MSLEDVSTYNSGLELLLLTMPGHYQSSAHWTANLHSITWITQDLLVLGSNIVSVIRIELPSPRKQKK
ncbi:hypothetical protein C0J52_20158 [Blattella germanica]|nr:hypothetical protein C0J52_20158 [Blattella germanica]